jgi:hypothetical protein
MIMNENTKDIHQAVVPTKGAFAVRWLHLLAYLLFNELYALLYFGFMFFVNIQVWCFIIFSFLVF